MRTLRSLLTVLLCAGAFVVMGPNPAAYACSCVSSSTEDYVERADVIVEATVDRVDTPGMFGGDTVRYTLDVHDVLKGQASKRLEFESAASGAACGLEGVQSEERMVFFLQQGDSTLTANLCGGTGNVEVSQVVGAMAAAGERPTAAERRPEPGSSSEGPEPWTWAAAALALLAAAGAGYWYSRPRRAAATGSAEGSVDPSTDPSTEGGADHVRGE